VTLPTLANSSGHCPLVFNTWTCSQSVGLIFVDWEYGVNLGNWDDLPSADVLRERVIAINAVNTNPDTLAFNW
jgi:hypothetical protein